MAVFSPNPEDYAFPEPSVFDPDAAFRFNPDLEDARDRRLRLDRRAHARARAKPIFPAVAARPTLFTFDPRQSLFLHFPLRIESLLAATLHSPKKLDTIRRTYLYSGKNLQPNWFEEAFKEAITAKRGDLRSASYSTRYTPTQRERLTELMAAAKKALDLRGRLRRFLHRWRVSRLQAVNTDDIVTFEPPRHPVRIVDWSRSQVYTYEAATLAQDIRTRLLNHDGFFEEPMDPRNPLTNLPFTLAQNVAVWIQLTSAGINLATVVTGFRHSRYNLQRFDQEFNTILKLHALRTTLMNPTNGDSIERMEEFVDLVHSSLRRPTPDRVDFAVWRPFCLRYYEADFLHINHPAMIRRVQAAIVQEMVNSGLVKEPPIFPQPVRTGIRRFIELNDHFYHVRVAPHHDEDEKEDDGPAVPPVLPAAPLVLPAAVEAVFQAAMAGAAAAAGAPAAADDADTVTDDEAESVADPPETPPVNANPNAIQFPDVEALLEAQFELELSLALAMSMN